MGDDPSDRTWRLTADGRVYRRGKQVYANRDEYDGEFLDGMRHGRGVMRFSNGDVYEGEFELNTFHGFGMYFYQSFEDDNGELIMGKRYEGYFRNGYRHGKGVFVLGDGDVYTGELEKGLYHGKGSLRTKNGDSYTGVFARGKGGGQIKVVYANDDVYEGLMMSGMYEGRGKLVYARGMGWYEGEWKRGLRHGSGTRVFMNGSKYVGQFVEGEPTGEGVMSFVNGDQYMGALLCGRPHGLGVMKYVTGERYEGTFRQGVIYGEGKYFYSDGGFYQGEFKNTVTRSGKLLPLLDGKRHGFGVRVFSNGSRYEGQWDGDVAEGSGELHGVAGGKYEGSFWNGHRHGSGSEEFGNVLGIEYICPLGHKHPGQGYCKYIGSWHKGGMTGSGILTCQDGRYYRGDFVDSQRHGQGYYYYLREGDEGDADRFYSGGRGSLYRIKEYEGAWQQGVREGRGCATWVNCDTVEGVFRAGQPHGVCLYTYKSGRRRWATFMRGSLVRWEADSAGKALSVGRMLKLEAQRTQDIAATGRARAIDSR